MDSLHQRFAELFVGGDQAHGLWDERRGAKTDHGPATPEHYAEHLAGKLGLGLVPVRRDGTCRFAAIDIDINSIDHEELLRKVLARKLPLAVCRSKSGGAHLYLFAREPGQPAAQIIQTLKKWATLLGYPAAEVFPKQTKVTKKNLGNWINLPYFGDAKTSRYAVGPRGALSLAEFLASVRPYDPALAIDESVDETSSEMPPCLQTLSQHGVPEGHRNQALFNFAVFYRKSNPNDWEDKVTAHNASVMQPPLAYREVRAVIKSVDRMKYQYVCDQEPIHSLCNRTLCVTMRFGVSHMPWQEAGTYDELMVSNLRKLPTDPPFYHLEVNGNDLPLTSEELFKFPRFRHRVAELLDLILPPMKQPRWDHQIKQLLATKVDLEMPDEADVPSQVLRKFYDFLAMRERTRSEEDLLRGFPIEREGFVLFRAFDLQRYLHMNRLFSMDLRRFYLTLRAHGCEQRRLRVLGQRLKVWAYPVDKINEQGEEFTPPAPAPEEGL
jgi:hypothetical protein